MKFKLFTPLNCVLLCIFGFGPSLLISLGYNKKVRHISGDIFLAFASSFSCDAAKVVKIFSEAGSKLSYANQYLMLRNIDTVGANIDQKILGLFLKSKSTLSFEVISRDNGKTRIGEAPALPTEEDDLKLSYYNSVTRTR